MIFQEKLVISHCAERPQSKLINSTTIEQTYTEPHSSQPILCIMPLGTEGNWFSQKIDLIQNNLISLAKYYGNKININLIMQDEFVMYSEGS